MADSEEQPHATVVYWDYCLMPLGKNAIVPRILSVLKSRIWHRTGTKSPLEVNLYIPSISSTHNLPRPLPASIHQQSAIRVHQTMNNNVDAFPIISQDIQSNKEQSRAIALVHPVAKCKRWAPSIKSNPSISHVFLIVFGGMKSNQSPAPSFVDEIIHIDCGCRPEELEQWRKYRVNLVKSAYSIKSKKIREQKDEKVRRFKVTKCTEKDSEFAVETTTKRRGPR